MKACVWASLRPCPHSAEGKGGEVAKSKKASPPSPFVRERKGARGENDRPPVHPGARSPRLPRSGNSALFALPRIEQKKSTLLYGQIGKKGLTSTARGCIIKQKIKRG